MEAMFTDKALRYLKSIKAKEILVQFIPGETNTGWGCGRTRRYYVPSITIKFNTQEVSDSYVEIETDFEFKLYVQSSKINIIKDKKIILDLESFLFVKKIVLKDLNMILVW